MMYARFLMLAFALLPLVSPARAENLPPSHFEVYGPTIITTVPGRTLIVFDWAPSTDPEGGIVSYRLLVWQGYYIVAEIRNILETHFSFDVDVEAPTWRDGIAFGFDVQAIDSAGNRVFGWQSTPYEGTRTGDSPTVVPGYLWGYIYDSVTGDPVPDAVVYTRQNVAKSVNGAYGVQVQPGAVSMTVTAAGYTDHAADLLVAEGEVVLRNIAMRSKDANGRAVIWGYVVDDTLRKVVNGATISIGGRSYPVESGSYMISVTPGTHRFRCEAAGFAPLETDITLQSEEFLNRTFGLFATSEHAWLDRDGVRLRIHLSGMQATYDLYVVAALPEGLLSLRGVPSNWQWGIHPLASNASLFTATYQLQILPEEDENMTTGATIYACLVAAGSDPLDTSAWRAFAELNWDKPAIQAP